MPTLTALLALPGLGLGPEAWQPTLRHLTGTGTAYVRLSPGYGQPARRGHDVRPSALAQDVLSAVPVDATRVVVLAHSAGCQLAAHVAASHPDRVAALVLVGPTTDPRAATWHRLQARWLATAVREDPRQVPVLARQYSRTTLRAMARAMEAARHDAILQTLDDVTAPVLVVRGRRDRICPQDWAQAVAARGGPGSRALTLPEGAHMVPLTHGRELAEVVTDVVTSLDGPT